MVSSVDPIYSCPECTMMNEDSIGMDLPLYKRWVFQMQGTNFEMFHPKLPFVSKTIYAQLNPFDDMQSFCILILGNEYH